MKLWYLVVLLLIAEVASKCKRCFPTDFLWGAATSAYQIEGAWNISGKGENIWDWWTHAYPEKISNGHNGDIAANSYEKYAEDVELLSNLGVDTYRFSISWSRVLPEGTINNINQDGVNYYLNLLKLLKSKGIEPLVTLYHWDLPIKLHQLGGWSNPQIADFFADYANFCFEQFGAYVKYWMTLNEPISQCAYGYGMGLHAPGYDQSGTLTYMCAKTQLLAHAKAYRIYNDTFKATQNGQVGIVLVSLWYNGLTDSEDDKAAAERGAEWAFGLFANPIFNGNWPEIIIDRVGNLSQAQGFTKSRLPSFTDTENTLIKGTSDFLGFNYYTTLLATPIANITATENSTVSYAIDRNLQSINNYNWTQAASSILFDHPEGIREMLNWVNEKYNKPNILITENGWSDEHDTLNDTERITYLKGHLCNVFKAKYKDGVNVFGYTHWSLLDNFEWGSGYTEGFGLVAVNFTDPNRTRTPKQSYYVYQDIVQSNCLDHCSMRD